MSDIIETISCPFCTGTRGDCCRCQGTRRIDYGTDVLAWAWARHGCQCAACLVLRAEWERILEATRPSAQPAATASVLPPQSKWANYPACAHCTKRGPHVERINLTWLHRECRDAYQAEQNRPKAVNE